MYGLVKAKGTAIVQHLHGRSTAHGKKHTASVRHFRLRVESLRKEKLGFSELLQQSVEISLCSLNSPSLIPLQSAKE